MSAFATDPFLQIVQQRQRDVRPEPEELERRTALLRCPGRRAPRHDLHLERGPDQVPADGRDQPGERVPEGALHLQVLEDAAQPDRDRFRPAGQTQLQVGLGEPFGQRVPHRLRLHQAVAGRLQSLLQLVRSASGALTSFVRNERSTSRTTRSAAPVPQAQLGLPSASLRSGTDRAVRTRNPGMVGAEDLVDVAAPTARSRRRARSSGPASRSSPPPTPHRRPGRASTSAAAPSAASRSRSRSTGCSTQRSKRRCGVGPGRVRLQQQPLELLDVGRGSPPRAGTARPTAPTSASFGVVGPTSSGSADGRRRRTVRRTAHTGWRGPPPGARATTSRPGPNGALSRTPPSTSQAPESAVVTGCIRGGDAGQPRRLVDRRERRRERRGRAGGEGEQLGVLQPVLLGDRELPGRDRRTTPSSRW